MPETVTTPATEQKPAEAEQQTSTATEPTKVEELPQWAQDLISQTRSEAAGYRVEKNTAVEAAKQEVTDALTAQIAAAQAETATVKSDLEKATLENLRLTVAIDEKISHDKVKAFADLLKGDDEAQLRSHATELKKLFTTEAPSNPAVDPAQGSGNHLPLNGDPLLDALKAKVGLS